MIRSISALILIFCLSGCLGINNSSTKTYYDEITDQYIIKSPIIKPDMYQTYGPKSELKLILSKDVEKEEYLIKVKWKMYSKYRPGIGLYDSLKFHLSNGQIIQLDPMKPGYVTKLDINQRGMEEEAVYKVDREIIEMIALDTFVDIYVQGARFSTRGSLDERSQLEYFKSFLRSIDNIEG